MRDPKEIRVGKKKERRSDVLLFVLQIQSLDAAQINPVIMYFGVLEGICFTKWAPATNRVVSWLVG
jgi:hypothetical protein